MIHQPQLIILDEPFSRLDPVNADLLKNAVLDAKKRDAVIIFSSHDMSNVEEICDSLIMLKKGKVILSGSIDSVRDSFGKTEIFCKTTKSLAELQQLPHVKTVEKQLHGQYLLRIDDEKSGPEVFAALTHGKYVEEFRQQPPTLDVRMEAVSNMNKLWIVTLQTYWHQVKSWSFLLLILGPFFIIGYSALGGALNTNSDENSQIALISSNKQMRRHFIQSNSKYVASKIKSVGSAKKVVQKEKIDGYLVLGIQKIK